LCNSEDWPDPEEKSAQYRSELGLEIETHNLAEAGIAGGGMNREAMIIHLDDSGE